MLTLERLLNDALMGRRTAPRRAAPKTKLIAIFPCGAEGEIQKRGQKKFTHFAVAAPNGKRYESSLRDVRHFLDSDFPGVRYERRQA